jgi:pimeloyl-ACP methyl ester carboxylesterase
MSTSLPVRDVAIVNGSKTVFWQYAIDTAPRRADNVSVVLVHGFRGDHHGLEAIASQVNAHRVIVPDLPGFGESDALMNGNSSVPHSLENLAQWLAHFIAQVTTGRVILVGHSFGTLVVAAALKFGAAADRIVLINPISSPALKGPRGALSKLALGYYRLGRHLPHRLGMGLLRHPFIVRFMSGVMTKTTDKELQSWIHREHHTHFSSFSDRKSLYEAFESSISHTVTEYAGFFNAPTSIIAADRDDITPLSAQLMLQKIIPQSTLIVVPHVGHLIHYEEPITVSKEINRLVSNLTNDVLDHGAL